MHGSCQHILSGYYLPSLLSEHRGLMHLVLLVLLPMTAIPSIGLALSQCCMGSRWPTGSCESVEASRASPLSKYTGQAPEFQFVSLWQWVAVARGSLLPLMGEFLDWLGLVMQSWPLAVSLALANLHRKGICWTETGQFADSMGKLKNELEMGGV